MTGSNNITRTCMHALSVTLDSDAGKSFKGFIIQAREGAEGSAVGSFLLGDDHKTLDCDIPKVGFYFGDVSIA